MNLNDIVQRHLHVRPEGMSCGVPEWVNDIVQRHLHVRPEGMSCGVPEWVYFMRHGRPRFPGEGSYCLGRTDLPLSKEGREQASKGIDFVKKAGIEIIFTSPLCRAVETARIISEGKLPIIVDTDFTELDMGEWEGLSFEQIRRQYPREYEARKDDFLIPPPGGESGEAGYERFRRGLEKIQRKRTDRALVVAHRSVIAVYTGQMLKYGQIMPWVSR